MDLSRQISSEKITPPPPPHYSLPEDVVFTQILSRLPVKSLMRFKCVSKTWFAYISSDPDLVATHLDRQHSKSSLILAKSYLNRAKSRVFLLLNESKTLELDVSYISRSVETAPSVEIYNIVGSFNGLLCLEIGEPDLNSVMLCNPATREFRYLPRPDFESVGRRACFGFGFDGDANDYKVVRIFSGDRGPLHVHVYTKSSNSWRRLIVGGGGGKSGLVLSQDQSAVAANGALYWSAIGAATLRHCVLSFSIRDEVLQVTEVPVMRESDKFYEYDIKLVKWMESLVALIRYDGFTSHDCYFRSLIVNGVGINIDMMNISWSKMFVLEVGIPRGNFWTCFRGVWGESFLLNKDSELLLYEHPIIGYGSDNRKESTYWSSKILIERLPGPDWNFHEAHDYVESLVSVF
ncbi:F-box domain containing protein [Trema orientale]|uniref:F-box domain containing protein n=1 Tax=Trema orientale TaxID=63057 RepID=A0A2P5FIF0_TREOI|nr:F-box domain containing protein [Trema orientale]